MPTVEERLAALEAEMARECVSRRILIDNAELLKRACNSYRMQLARQRAQLEEQQAQIDELHRDLERISRGDAHLTLKGPAAQSAAATMAISSDEHKDASGSPAPQSSPAIKDRKRSSRHQMSPISGSHSHSLADVVAPAASSSARPEITHIPLVRSRKLLASTGAAPALSELQPRCIPSSDPSGSDLRETYLTGEGQMNLDDTREEDENDARRMRAQEEQEEEAVREQAMATSSRQSNKRRRR
jgi:hypothetical protein